MNLTLQTPIIEYYSLGYPQRSFSQDIYNLNNITTVKTLYALGSDTGVLTQIVVIDEKGAPVGDALVDVYRYIGGVLTISDSQYTDDTGTATFFLNPTVGHIATFNKSGCVSMSKSFTPIAGSFEYSMACGEGGVLLLTDYVSSTDGLQFRFAPSSGPLGYGVNNFELRVMNTKQNMNAIRIELFGTNGSLFAAATKTVGEVNCSNYDCYVNLTWDTNFSDPPTVKTKARYFANLSGDWYILENDAYWTHYIIPTENVSSNMKNAWTSLRHVFDNWSEDTSSADALNRAEFSRIFFIFLIICLLFAAFNKMSGYDSANPGAFLIIMTGIFWMGSLAGGRSGEGFFYLIGLTPIHFLNNYIIAIYMFFITLAYFLNVNRRAAQ